MESNAPSKFGGSKATSPEKPAKQLELTKDDPLDGKWYRIYKPRKPTKDDPSEFSPASSQAIRFDREGMPTHDSALAINVRLRDGKVEKCTDVPAAQAAWRGRQWGQLVAEGWQRELTPRFN